MNAEKKTAGVRTATMEELWALMLPQLSQGGTVRLTVSGCSMHPMLRSRRDTVVLREDADLRKGDLILFRREDGSFVLHRIVRVKNADQWIVCGDNQYEPEIVERDQVLAKMTEFIRGGKTFRAEHPGYKAYVAIWVWLFPVRRPLLAMRRFCGRIVRKMKRKQPVNRMPG